MRWIKANPTTTKKENTKKKISKGKSQRESEPVTRTAIMFNPQLWKEEIVILLED
jgi:hypothetical protein